MKKYILFGAGKYGENYIRMIGKEDIVCVCDNFSGLWGSYVEDILIVSPESMESILEQDTEIKILISTSNRYKEEVALQLSCMGLDSRIIRIEDILDYKNDVVVVDEEVTYYGGIYDDVYNKSEAFHKMEYLKGEIVEKQSIREIYAEKDKMFAVKPEYPDTIFTLKKDGKKYEKELIWKYEYFKLKKGEKVTISSNKDIVLSDSISMTELKLNSCKMNLLIICDSLAQVVFNNDKLEKLMPNTFRFFKKAMRFNNCYSGSDWTLPGIATIHTGSYSIQHKLVHPREKENKANGTVIAEVFKKEGFLTSSYGSNWRAAPNYGYIKGVDRMVYVYGKNKGSGLELISNFMEFVKAFPERKHFAVLNLFDLHHHIKEVPDISSQLLQSLEEHFYSDKDGGKKSVFKGYDEVKSKMYLKEVTKLDNYMGFLYFFLEEKYGSDMNVILAADHGVTYLHPQKVGADGQFMQITLDEQMTKVPLMIKTKNSSEEVVETVIDNTCIFKVLEKIAQGETGLDNKTIKDMIEIPYAYNESIYPGQTYKATIIDDNYEVVFINSSLVDDSCSVTIDESGYLLEIRNKKTGEIEDDDNLRKKYFNIIKEHVGVDCKEE